MCVLCYIVFLFIVAEIEKENEAAPCKSDQKCL
jgi:hypothetical protein